MSTEEIPIIDRIISMDNSLDDYAKARDVTDISDSAIGTALQLSRLVGQLLFEVESPFDPRLIRIIGNGDSTQQDDDVNIDTLPKAFVIGFSIGLVMCIDGYRNRSIQDTIENYPKLD